MGSFVFGSRLRTRMVLPNLRMLCFKQMILPLPPKLSLVSHQESVEIFLNSTCDKLQLSLGLCDIQYRIMGDKVWLEDTDVVQGSYSVDSLQPGTVHDFRVRCSCYSGLKSDWSAIHSIRSTETAPDGELDVWRDCGISQKSSDCVVTWKKLPIYQAHGLIVGYKVSLFYNNNTSGLVTLSPAEPKGRLACKEMQCHFTSPLKDVASVSVSAYNSRGATVRSFLTIPIPGKEKNKQAIRLVMNEEKLTVSWDLPSPLSDRLKEYVVQYKQAGSPPGQGFDWIRVKKSATTGIFDGPYRFRRYTPYQVSLFTVSNSGIVHHLSSAIGYSVQGIPSSVPSFKVFSIESTHVTLLWESIPLHQQSGVILYYQIVVESGADRQNVYNVSVLPQRDNETFQLLHLSPGHEYEVQIRAVTAVGPGENKRAKFKTKDHETYGRLIAIVLGVSLLVVACVVFVSYCASHAAWFSYKVPDARNSLIFLNMKHQVNDSLAWICIPIYEPDPKISLLEVVETQPWPLRSSLEKTSDPLTITRLVVGDEGSQMNCQDDSRQEAVAEETGQRHEREKYSKMVDSDEEKDREEDNREDCWSSSEEDQLVSGYEKHFMPTALEVLEV
ncbi:interleukin 12 receptor, beta 2a, like isoform X1 [Clinocottus analis]|uniref:interleukin 12 receptor, beta 2a, like isoform X1 n=1 Tax=Clinocottus analis TaxID=304258 RepID=UPI0035BFB414